MGYERETSERESNSDCVVRYVRGVFNSMFTPGITTRVINKYAPKIEEAVRQVELDREYAL